MFCASSLLIGCGDTLNSKTYAPFSMPSSLKVITKDATLTQEIVSSLKDHAIKTTGDSSFTLVCMDSSLQSCTNPQSLNKGHQEGYLRCSLYESENELYRIQQNYLQVRDVEKVIERFVNEMKEK